MICCLLIFIEICSRMELQNEFRINYFKFEIKRKIVQMISNKFLLWQEKKTDYNKNILYIYFYTI